MDISGVKDYEAMSHYGAEAIYTLFIMINHKSFIFASIARPCARPVDAVCRTLAKARTLCKNIAFAISHSEKRITAAGERNAVPHHAVTMGMKQILAAREILLLACFPEQEAPLNAIIENGVPTPFYPASYLLTHANSKIVFTKDTIRIL